MLLMTGCDMYNDTPKRQYSLSVVHKIRFNDMQSIKHCSHAIGDWK